MDNLIFIGGIHGVGKTTICNEMINTYQIAAYSASKIISDLKNQNFPSNKLIPDIDVNQALLIEGLKRIESTDQLFILDGHFCLINEKSTVSKISETVFEEIKPIALIVITDMISNIALRLKMRDNIDYELSLLEQFQDEELKNAKFLSSKLSIPIHIYDHSNDSQPQLHEFITKLGEIK